VAYTKLRKDDWLKALYIHNKSLVLAHVDNDIWASASRYRHLHPLPRLRNMWSYTSTPVFTS
jgi:hypothetical protein